MQAIMSDIVLRKYSNFSTNSMKMHNIYLRSLAENDKKRRDEIFAAIDMLLGN